MLEESADSPSQVLQRGALDLRAIIGCLVRSRGLRMKLEHANVSTTAQGAFQVDIARGIVNRRKWIAIVV